MLPCFCTFTIMGIVFCHFLMLHQIFFPPQMKQTMNDSNKHGIDMVEISEDLIS